MTIPKVKWSFLPVMQSLNGLFYNLAKHIRSCALRNHELKEIVNTHSVQSSLNSHPEWVTLYFLYSRL